MKQYTVKEEFWQKHHNWFIPFVSEFYPLNKFQLLQYEDILDWDRIAVNQFICWDKESATYFRDKIENPEWIDSKLLRMEIWEEGKLVTDLISLDELPNPFIYLKGNREGENAVYWKDLHFGCYIIPEFDENTILPFMNKFDCGIQINGDPYTTLPIPTTFLSEKRDFLEWDRFSGYFGLNWSFELLQKFENYWDTEQLICNPTAFNYCLKNDLDDEFIDNALSGA